MRKAKQDMIDQKKQKVLREAKRNKKDQRKHKHQTKVQRHLMAQITAVKHDTCQKCN